MLERERSSFSAIPSRAANSSSSRRSNTLLLGFAAFGARFRISLVRPIVIYCDLPLVSLVENKTRKIQIQRIFCDFIAFLINHLFLNELNIKRLDMRKKRQDSFANDAEESVIDRIAQLVRRHPSRSAAARAWGININTLNSYFKNDMPAPMPREYQLSKIAESEGVSLRWLTTGDGEPPKSQKTREYRDKLSEILDFLTEDERLRLATALARKGVEAILHLLDEDNINSPKQNQSPTQQPATPPTGELTPKEAEALIMSLPVRDSLKAAFARGLHANKEADQEILRILESHERAPSPDGDSVPSVTPDSALKQKNG
ncbi:hypothetical protein KIN55_003912 [Salmonella enterica]|nr:hypothetical protein [Salmonella enterica]EJA7139122.1 hypothetical protein [Salmonella enterica]